MRIINNASSTFQSVEEKNDKIWKLQRYSLVFEYKESSFFPPPFNLIGYLFEMIQEICTFSKEKGSILLKITSNFEIFRFKSFYFFKIQRKSKNKRKF